MRRIMAIRPTATQLLAGALLVAAAPLCARAASAPARPANSSTGEAGISMSAQAQAPFDATGYWVSIVTQDWVFRMVVPQRGQYTDIPLTPQAKQFADAWQPAPDEAAGKQCEAYGAAAIMQVPGRLRIRWQDANTLEVQTDAGSQTRWLHFQPSAAAASAPPSWQGYTTAQWMLYREAGAPPPQRAIPPGAQPGVAVQVVGASAPMRDGWLKAVTTDLRPGLLRENGVPYSGQIQMTENWVLNSTGEAYGGEWLTVTTILRDPLYLSGPFVQNALFNREPDGSRWDPRPCTLRG